ncbi:MAG: hypothetical protein HY718_09470 [Planctomycetes bacterium]|nr:hypothetical protein [Planctomycetota bacterium]
MKNLLVVLALLALVSPVMAVPLNYVETWDSYGTGTGDASYNANWATQAGASRYSIMSNTSAFSPENNLDQEVGVALGIENNLGDGVEMPLGAYLQPTAANKVIAGIYWNPVDNNRQTTNFVFELLQGSTVVAGAANSKVIDAGNNNPYWWNGANWIRETGGKVFAQASWNHIWLEITPNSTSGFNIVAHVDAFTRANPIWSNVAATGIDKIRIRSVGTTDDNSWIDNVYVTGGEIVPEPSALLILALGGLPLLRRRRG